MNRCMLATICLLVLAGCGQQSPSPTASVSPAAATRTPNEPTAQSTPPATAGAAGDAAERAPAFADIVWKTTDASAVEAGSTYTFLGDGTLVMDSPHGEPSYGRWTYADDTLVMIEEGLSYPTDILRHDADHLRLRSRNPGGSVILDLQRARGVPLPASGKAAGP